MNYPKLSELLFPEIDKTPEDYEKIYPERNLPEGALVTRLGPSPTGFIHLGNLYGALIDERLAHQSGGICFLRVEDTDEKREVEGAVPALISTLEYFGIHFDEGVCADGEKGGYGPYHQSAREEIYKCHVKKLISEGKAYPCFLTEEEIAEIRAAQEAAKINPGIYGSYARCRDLDIDEIERRIAAGEEYVVRFKAPPDCGEYFTVKDAIRGEISMPINTQDVVILKKGGLPTYHFAHVVDDHLMRTTHVVRGEEWMASLPIHVQLFEALGWELPVYCHNTMLMKIDEESGQRRKLSKRKDPELSLGYYKELGYFPEAVREYLMTILNSNYEEWRIANPFADYNEFAFSTATMSDSGTLFDIDKLNDVSREVLSKKSADEIYDFMLEWAEEHNEGNAALMRANKDMLLKVFDIDRGGEKPRKDLVYAEQIFDFIKYFFEERFEYEDDFPAEVSAEDRAIILASYGKNYDPADDNAVWFEKLRNLGASLGYAAKPRDFKKNPDSYKGHVGHVSGLIRVAVTGRANSPDLWTVQQIMGPETVKRRIERAERRA